MVKAVHTLREKVDGAMFTRVWFQMFPVELNRIGLLFTRDRSGTGPEPIKNGSKTRRTKTRVWIRLKPFCVGSRTVPLAETDAARFGSERFRSGPV